VAPPALSVSLGRFIELLRGARDFDGHHPQLNQTEWLLGSRRWAFSDTGAIFTNKASTGWRDDDADEQGAQRGGGCESGNDFC